MKKHDSSGQAGTENEIEITPEMIEAGLQEMREHHYDTDVGYMLECVYRAMVYATRQASSSKLLK